MINSTLKKIFGVFMIVLGIVFLFVPLVPSSPFFILGALALGFVTKDYIKMKLSLRKDGLIKNKEDAEKRL
jgi:uncharacterized membrane protein YbaN (DUF454 family)